MPRCTRRGCGKEFVDAENTDTSCVYHSGTAVFHEGLKSWSCCSSLNKPVLDFDDFMKIPGCAVGTHSLESATSTTKSHKTPAQVNLTAPECKAYPAPPPPKTTGEPSTSATESRSNESPQEDEDDLTVAVPPGKPCTHRGCGVAFVSDEENRIGDGAGTICTYHPSPPIFREGSKGYLCCKRRGLEFEEFLKIEGCKKGRHVFIPRQKTIQNLVEQSIACRIDHHQTRQDVHMTIFAKQADQEKSTIVIEESQVHLDVFLPGPKIFRRTIHLFGPVKPQESSYVFHPKTVQVTLKKSDDRSWTLLEKTGQPLEHINFTFGVGGRTGTVGGKVIHNDQNSMT